MRLWRRRMNLADRLRPYIQSAEPLEPMVSADPIRLFLFKWMIETGDPVEVVAKGFDLDLGLVEGILTKEDRALDASVAVKVALALRLDPRDLWADQRLEGAMIHGL